uniref:Uncharacterized protein n=1 Tax=Setaria italica TaxID=4555 RepID=K3YFQ1_SETIT
MCILWPALWAFLVVRLPLQGHIDGWFRLSKDPL